MVIGRIFARVVETEQGCLVWQGATNGDGYGQIRVGKKVKYVHRLAWEDEHGAIPGDLTIDHLCLVTLCVNTNHMELVSREENARRANPRLDVCCHGHDLADSYAKKDGGRNCRPCSIERSAMQS